MVFLGKFHGNDVPVEMKGIVGSSPDSMVEFGKEVSILDKFR